MENIATVVRALRFSRDNYDNPTDDIKRDKAIKAATKLGVTIDDLKALRDAETLPVDKGNEIKASIVDKVAKITYGQDTGQSPLNFEERFNIKNLIDEDPELQVKYLDSKGYEARFNQNDELEARKKGSRDFFRLVDPSRFEFMDFVDVMGDGIQAGIEGFITAGIPFLAQAGVGGAFAGAYEGGKQGLAKTMGLRDDMNYGRIAEKAALGAVFPLLPVAAGALPKYIARSYAEIPKPNREEIIAIGKKLGATPTEGMLSNNRVIQINEDWLAKSPNQTIFNRNLRNQISKNIEATDAVAESILKDRIPMSRVEAGDAIRESITKSLQERKDYAESIYDEVAKKISKQGYQVPTDPIYSALKNLEDDFMFSKTGRSWIKDITEDVGKISTIDHLKRFRTTLSSDIAKHSNDPLVKSGITKIRGLTKKLESETFDTVLTNMEDSAKSFISSQPANLKNRLTELAQERLDDITNTRNKLMEADQIWRTINEESDVIMKNIGENTKGGITKKITKIGNMPIESVFKKILSEGDVKKAEWMMKNYPEEFTKARGVVLEEIFQKGENVRKGAVNRSFGSQISGQIRNMSPSQKRILFGVEGTKKADLLAKWFSELPEVINPSGTNQAQRVSRWLIDHADQGFVQLKLFLVKGLGNFIDNPVTRGGAYSLGADIFKNKDTSKANTIIPQGEK